DVVRAGSPVTVRMDMERPTRTIPEDFCGLSYETKMVLANTNTGKHYFRGDNLPLVTAFKTMGIKHLRVGGNTAERPTVNIPDEKDIDHLFAFAKEAGVKVIYSVRLQKNTPEAAAKVAKYVNQKYGDLLSCFILGNEPNKDMKYPEFLADWKKFREVIASKEFVPSAKFCAPTSTDRNPDWSRDMAGEPGMKDMLAFIGQHYYPGGDGPNIKDIVKARDDMLSPAWHPKYQAFHDIFVPAVLKNGLKFRMNEGSSFSKGGALGASDTYSASLWILDYLYWWAHHDASGLNFHSGQKVLPGTTGPDKPNVYTPLTSSAHGYTILPPGYGIKMFELGSHGDLLPVEVSQNKEKVNLVAYGVKDSGNVLYVTLINREYGVKGRVADVRVETKKALNKVETITLSQENGDISQVEGVTVGGAKIAEDGTWKGSWMPLARGVEGTGIKVEVPPATAILVKVGFR
ncbi:hypothetical protein EBX31_11900, partial [bacterium]|nr:hypothetical protein [bacterium]